MSRRLRYIPDGGALVEVTCRTLQGRFLLQPSRQLNEVILGILGRAQRLNPVRICAFTFLSTHFHLLLDVDDAQQLSRFMGYLNSNLAREVGRLADWREKVWSKRYQAIVVSTEEGAQIDRLRYLLAHGVKEDLVPKLRDWPGVHAVRALLDGKDLEGLWFDRTQEYAARRRGETYERLQYASAETITLSPLPCWKHLSPEAYQSRIVHLVEEIESEAATRRANTGRKPLGMAAIQGQDPHARPRKLKRSPAPLFHAMSQNIHKELYEGYAWFTAAFRKAAEKLKTGDRMVVFPTGSFPPALPFAGG
jgi:REP element-mobilizing transposase RayT